MHLHLQGGAHTNVLGYHRRSSCVVGVGLRQAWFPLEANDFLATGRKLKLPCAGCNTWCEAVANREGRWNGVDHQADVFLRAVGDNKVPLNLSVCQGCSGRRSSFELNNGLCSEMADSQLRNSCGG